MMATKNAPESNSTQSPIDTLSDDEFVNISVVRGEVESSLARCGQSVSVESIRSKQTVKNQPWQFIPTEYLPSTGSLSDTLPQPNRENVTTLNPIQKNLYKMRKQISLPQIMKRKRSVSSNTNSPFSSYDIIDPYESPSTEELEKEMTQSLINETVLVDQCLIDDQNEQMVKTLQLSKHIPSKKRTELFMARSESRWQAAVNALKLSVEEDQQMHGIWLLSEIDHWDSESERVVMLLDDSLLIAKYNFHFKVLQQLRSIGFSGIYAVSHGPFCPLTSMLKKRPGIGVRLHWNKDARLSKAQEWNPWSEKIPFTTLGPHPSTYNTVQCTTEEHLNIHSFLHSLKECLKTYSIANDSDVIFNAVDALLPHSSKFGILQQIHNRAKLGCDTISISNN